MGVVSWGGGGGGGGGTGTKTAAKALYVLYKRSAAPAQQQSSTIQVNFTPYQPAPTGR